MSWNFLGKTKYPMCLLYKKPKLSDITNLNHNWKYGQWQIKWGIHRVPFNSLLLTIMSCKALSVSKRCPDKSSSLSRWCLINKCPSVAAHQKLVWANQILHHVQSARRQCVNTFLLSRGKRLHSLPFHNLIHTPKTRATLLPKLLLGARRCLDVYSKESRAVGDNLLLNHLWTPLFTRRLLLSWNQSTPQRNKGLRFNPLKQLYTQTSTNHRTMRTHKTMRFEKPWQNIKLQAAFFNSNWCQLSPKILNEIWVQDLNLVKRCFGFIWESSLPQRESLCDSFPPWPPPLSRILQQPPENVQLIKDLPFASPVTAAWVDLSLWLLIYAFLFSIFPQSERRTPFVTNLLVNNPLYWECIVSMWDELQLHCFVLQLLTTSVLETCSNWRTCKWNQT